MHKPKSNKYTFDIHTFIHNYYKENTKAHYLRMCNLTYGDRKKIFTMCGSRKRSIDDECMKYIIECYKNGTFSWDETFDNICELTYCNPIQIICKYCSVKIILCMLVAYEKYCLDVDCYPCPENSHVGYGSNLHVWKRINFDKDTLGRIKSYKIHGNNCVYKYVMGMERQVFE